MIGVLLVVYDNVLCADHIHSCRPAFCIDRAYSLEAWWLCLRLLVKQYYITLTLLACDPLCLSLTLV
ncbi:hypothetical protein DSUL_260009 [Desulfovibrionales bacterium]